MHVGKPPETARPPFKRDGARACINPSQSCSWQREALTLADLLGATCAWEGATQAWHMRKEGVRGLAAGVRRRLERP